jgi:uncharacterized protein
VTKTTAFWDSSALVSLCVRQPASPRAHSLHSRFQPVVWWGSLVEIQSAFCRLCRDGDITQAERQDAQSRLRLLSAAWREILPGDRVREFAFLLLESYPLRAADSLQLAAAMIWCDQNPAGRRFICGDRRLSEAAESAGFLVLELP